MPSLDRCALPTSPPTSAAARPGVEGRVGRRGFLLSSAAAAISACSGGRPAATTRPAPPAPPTVDAPRSVELWSAFDLPAGDPRSRELSGIAWDAEARVLWAVHDESPAVVALIPDRDLRAWRFGETVALEIDGPVDLEGVALLPDGFIVCSEKGPRIIELDRAGRFRRDLALPARLRGARRNKSLESLSLSPSGRFLFTTTETTLKSDGAKATPRAGARVRIVRLDLDDADGAPSEHAYATDPVPHDTGDWGVSDLAALDDARLLVLERGWSRGHGNTVRVYETALDPRASCAETEALSPESRALGKTLVVDLAKLCAAGLPEPKQPQPTPLLDNFEGLALGPTLPDGRATLLLVSDDNGRADQFARVVVLTL
ncbi:MAG: esterase-like activity of phytase family protein [Labilithrix sp.]|nr:esterase-like activity of phytase family protein [Labilithrix sp.]